MGKTTACQNIAAALAKYYGKKIAVVDMDPQSNLSAGFGVAPSPEDPQVFDLLSGAATWDDIVKHKEGVDIIPSSLNLVMAELNEEAMKNNQVLRKVLQNVDPGRYDYIFLDSPPQLGIFTRNVLAACDKIIVPMDGGFYSLFGLRLLDSSLEVLSERLDNKLEIMGILMTNYNPRLYISRKIFEEVKKSFGDVLFENYVTQSVALVEASSVGNSIFQYSPKSKGADCYLKIADEFLSKLGDSKNFVEPSKSETSKPVKRVKKDEKTIEPEQIEIEIKEPEEPEKTEKNSEPLQVQESEKIEIIETKPEPKIEIEPEKEKITLVNQTVTPVKSSASVAGSYEEGIKQDILDMLPDSEKETWEHMLAPISDISRSQIDIYALREDFEASDKNRYTFYILSYENDDVWPVMYPDQIAEPLKCVIKWDELGSAEVFM